MASNSTDVAAQSRVKVETMSEQHSPPVLAALILAAGFSSRMGRFKALLTMEGEHVITRVVRSFRQAGIEKLGAVVGHNAGQIEPVLRDLGVDAIFNPDYERGMYSSVKAGVASLSSDVDACFLLPVDIPLVRSATIKSLVERFGTERAPITYPRFNGLRGHPPLISRALFAEIVAGNGDGGLRALLANHQSVASDVNVLDEGVVLDMDTPEDYERLAKLARHRHLPTLAECEAILTTQSVPDTLLRHGRAVTAVAGTIASRLAAHSVKVDLNLVLAAGLLHDVAKGQPDHAEAGASLVGGLGYPAVADVIRQHMAMSFDGRTTDEAAIVFLADKLVCKDRRVSLEERFQPSFKRFCGQPEALRGATRRYETAREILSVVEKKARAPMADILADCGVSM